MSDRQTAQEALEDALDAIPKINLDSQFTPLSAIIKAGERWAVALVAARTLARIQADDPLWAKAGDIDWHRQHPSEPNCVCSECGLLSRREVDARPCASCGGLKTVDRGVVEANFGPLTYSDGFISTAGGEPFEPTRTRRPAG